MLYSISCTVNKVRNEEERFCAAATVTTAVAAVL
jgi:hypothetical protein